MTDNAAQYSRPATRRATLTAYEANVMDALVWSALAYGFVPVIADITGKVDADADEQLDIASRACLAVAGRDATDAQRLNADTWNRIMRAAGAETYRRAWAA